MNHTRVRILAIGVLIVVALLVACQTDRADAAVRYRTPSDQFCNHYVPAVGYQGQAALLYVAPRPAPPLVGYTYITYEPLMPHEFLWKHCRCYKRIHPDGKRTKVHVFWD